MYSLKVIDLEYIQHLCKQEKIRWTNHILTRLLQRGIKQADIKNAILTGKIIEYYPDDYPHTIPIQASGTRTLVKGKERDMFYVQGRNYFQYYNLYG